MTRNLTIDLEFADRHGYVDAIIIALMRKNELERYPARISSAGGMARIYPMFFNIKTYRIALDRLRDNGYLSESKQYIIGKYPVRIFKMTDKAIREYNFGE